MTFEFAGGSLALDLANTVSGDRAGRSEELVPDYATLVRWAEEARVLSSRDAARLAREAAERPSAAAAELRRTLALREATFRVFAALSHGHEPPDDDVRRIFAEAAEARAASTLTFEGERPTWKWRAAAGLDRVRHAAARDAEELLTTERAMRVGECGGGTCSWLFLDTTKNRSRRWCSMADCGNREKQRRFRGEKKKPASRRASR